MFTPLAMGTNHMLGVDSYVPLYRNNFEIRIYNMDGSSPVENSDMLTLSTSEVGAIVENQDEITVHYGNGLVKFPQKVDYQDVDWTLNCYTSPNVLEGLRAWRRQVYNPLTECLGLPSQYMKTVYFIKYDGTGGTARDVIKCPGVWLKSINNGDMDQQGGLVQVTCTFVISRAIYLKPEDIQ